MNKSVQWKLGLVVVLILAWIVAAVIALRGFNQEVQFLQTSPRDVVMIDAWSFNNGSSREGYEGRFIDEKTQLEFTYRIDSWGYQSYKKNPVPTKGTLKISDNTVGINNSGWVRYFLGILLITLIFSAGMVVTALSLRFKRGSIYEVFCHLKGKDNG